jgi:glycosyltransferase involved in cell wall biosynthesis
LPFEVAAHPKRRRHYLKVALLSDWYLPRLGGLELHIRDLALGLTASGCEVHIVTPNPAAPGAQAHGLPAVTLPHPRGVIVHRLTSPLLPRWKIVYTRRAFEEIGALFARERFDVVQTMVSVISPAAIGGAWVARQMGIPTVVTFHSMLLGFRPVLELLDLASGWSRWPVLFSAVSGAVAAEAQDLVPGSDVHVLPNGVDATRWGVDPVPGSPGELRLASVMRLNMRKRGGPLLDAVARAQRRLGCEARLRLTLVGDGPQRHRLRRRARRLGLDQAVRFAGYLPREEVRQVLARSDVFVLASWLESFGIAALEARAAGVPVVALDRGGIKEFVRDGRDGLLARTDRELADRLVTLAREPDLLARLAEGAREQPVPHAWEDTLARHLEAYRAVIAGEAPVFRRVAQRPSTVHRPDAA